MRSSLVARRLGRAALATLTFWCLAAPAFPDRADARRVFVPRQHRRLQAAIDAAAPGDTVWVAAGTYRGPFVIKKSIVLFGDGGPIKTILDGRDSVRVLHIEGVSHAAIFGFRIQGGRAAGGSGIYCSRDTMLQIGSCDIRGNWEAGVALWQCGPVQIVDSEISGNHGSGLTASDSKVQLIHTTFRDNHGPSGGAVALTMSELTVARECVFQRNRADDGTGGGMFADASPLHFLNCVFRENTAAAGGGAISARDSSDLRIRSCFFAANRSASGGAVLTDLSSLDLQLSIFAKNRATAAGAAVQILGRRTAGVNPFITGNTFYRNGVDAQAGASVLAEDASPEITRNIFVIDSTARNKAVLEIRGSSRYVCNLVQTLDGAAPKPTENIIVGDPLFCDAEKDDFHVHDLSPAILAPCGRIGPLGKGCSSFRILPGR